MSRVCRAAVTCIGVSAAKKLHTKALASAPSASTPARSAAEASISVPKPSPSAHACGARLLGAVSSSNTLEQQCRVLHPNLPAGQPWILGELPRNRHATFSCWQMQACGTSDCASKPFASVGPAARRVCGGGR